jgi:hypothetical protein
MNFGTLLLSVAENPAIDQAIIQLVRGITSTALADLNIPSSLKTFLQQVETNAEALAGAALTGTPAAGNASTTVATAGANAIAKQQAVVSHGEGDKG